MTKRELLARLVHDPIVIEPLGMAGYHRVALHADRDPKNGVWIALASSTSTPVVRDRGLRLRGQATPTTDGSGSGRRRLSPARDLRLQQLATASKEIART